MQITYLFGLVAVFLIILIQQTFAQIGGTRELGDQIVGALIGGVISGSVISVIVGALFNRRATRIQEEIKDQFNIARSKRAWREQSVSELLGPVNMLLDRTHVAFQRWAANSLFLEAEIIAKSNQTIRDLLLTKGHLIPPELLKDASKLIEHYDRWLEEFNNIRNEKQPNEEEPFVFVGPQGFPFPTESAVKFQETFRGYWAELYGEKKSSGTPAQG
jgi:hypothetical protein